MKPLLKLGIWPFLLLSACGGPPSTLMTLSEDNSTAIIGGKETTKENVISKYLVLVYDNPTHTYCTGLLLSKRLILTAAHCLEKNSSSLILAFGLQPMSGNYILRKSAQVVPHPDYNKDGNSDRNDLALILIEGTAPLGYEPVSLPDHSFPIQAGLTFTAAGYGRTSGKNQPAQDSQGSGYLRHVELKIDSLSENENQFYVDQKTGRGICNGDSGGPALMRFLGKDYVVGVASAVSWTVPTDVCAEKSIYMNIKKFQPWILEASKKLGHDLGKAPAQLVRPVK